MTARPFRITVDTGGTFTDVTITDGDGRLHAWKHPTTHDDVWIGARAAVGEIARALDMDLPELLRRAGTFVWGTTRATNAIIESKTARTALLVTEGFPDTLVWREGGKHGPFDFREDYPRPYVPRRLTFEVPERVSAEGEVVRAIDIERVREVLSAVEEAHVEAIAVCLLWSIVNPRHELVVARELEKRLPGVPYSLSHVVNPVVREYRRASSAAIDASLKPIMQSHLSAMEAGLRADGFAGEVLTLTCFGGALGVPEVVSRPIFSVNSGPSTAPVAARRAAADALATRNVVVCDVGGTSFDISLVEEGEIRHSRDNWIGRTLTGHLMGVDAVAIKTIGAGGGSIARVDTGGLLHVGPESAGSLPGPASYRRGGTRATVTDAAVCLGYLTPDRFLGGAMALDVDAAARAVATDVAIPLGIPLVEAAHAVLAVTIENMVNAIADVTINAGVDPREYAIVAGGGAAGLVICAIAAELGCATVLVPEAAATMSAAGAQAADIVKRFSTSRFATADAFPGDAVNAVLAGLDRQMDEFLAGVAFAGAGTVKTFSTEARYANQTWELDVPLDRAQLDAEGLSRLVEAFHRLHERYFGASDRTQLPEFVRWNGRATACVTKPGVAATAVVHDDSGTPEIRPAYFPANGMGPVARHRRRRLGVATVISGPAVIDDVLTTIVVPPGWSATATAGGHVRLTREETA